MWIRLNPSGTFSDPLTGKEVLEPEHLTILTVIRGHAGSDPPKGFFICLGDGRFIGIHPDSGGAESEPVLDANELYKAACAVVNKGYAHFNDEAGKLAF